jgi:hypothetical protein
MGAGGGAAGTTNMHAPEGRVQDGAFTDAREGFRAAGAFHSRTVTGTQAVSAVCARSSSAG